MENIINDSNILEGIAWKRRQFHANEIIDHKGELGKSFFFIEEGKVRVTIHVAVGERLNIQAGVNDLQEGDFFGEIALFEARLRTATVTAITDQGYFFMKHLFETMVTRMTSGINRLESLMAWGLKAHGISKHL
jgi:CRP/FNR family transcriptional regulator, cyclic AMP receptor protein